MPPFWEPHISNSSFHGEVSVNVRVMLAPARVGVTLVGAVGRVTMTWERVGVERLPPVPTA